ncbi:MAG TPA: cysteine--tRNA ligase [Thermoanaerobaculia bacterium]|nr:cysteine--tRNA ligase [Thermoanaerobaculia bacterium]
MTEIRFWNTMGRALETFEPLEPGRVRVYTCGPTVYGEAHLGNMRTFLFEDVLCRALEYLGFGVEQVMNLTDVEDKIIAGAVARGVTLREFTTPHEAAFFRDLDRLHIRRAARYPRATEHVPEMVDLIARLIESGHAYQADGSIFFRIESDADYGRLSGVDLAAARRGERVADDEYGKEDVRDFVLWKAAKEDEPSWDSPWGPGRPGWHIECSAMSMQYLGETFDLHCGGVDNIFPHHENEIAQSESVTGRPLARYWLHSEHLLVDGRKMSKSLGNQYTLDDLIERGLDLRAVRYLLLSVHYRQKVNFTFASVEGAAAALRRIDDLRFRLDHARERSVERSDLRGQAARLAEEFGAALADDLNTSAALAALHRFVRDVNVTVEEDRLGPGDREVARSALCEIDGVLGVLHREEWGGAALAPSAGLGESEIETLVAEREAARQARDFARSDALRERLREVGVQVEDTAAGPRWRRE